MKRVDLPGVTLYQATVEEWAEEYDGAPFHALLTDAPYHLTSIVNRFGKEGSATPKPGPYQRSAQGFMGQEWDGGDVAFRPETWAALGQHLHPGAFAFAFAGTRGYHRMACAIEDAGHVLHPMIGWIYGSGFCKATRIDTQIDAEAGAEREVIGEAYYTKDLARNGSTGDMHVLGEAHPVTVKTTAPATPLAQAWAGHRYGLQALKPALEPICCFQRPYEGRPVECVTTTGAGALNIDAGRVSVVGEMPAGSGHRESWRELEGRSDRQPWNGGNTTPASGRWPANLALCHLPECRKVGQARVRVNDREHDRHNTAGKHSVATGEHTASITAGHAGPDGCETVDAWECAEGCPVKAIGEQSGELSPGHHPKERRGQSMWSGHGGGFDGNSGPEHYTDTGTAARFFHQADWALEHADPFLYCAKASRKERDAGLEGMPMHTGAELTGRAPGSAGLENPRAGAGRTSGGRNPHPCIKPIALTRWLATLLLPPAEYAPRRILVPFSGSGSEVIGAILAGWEEVVAVEMGAEFCTVAEARIRYWQGWRVEELRREREAMAQPSLFSPEEIPAVPKGRKAERAGQLALEVTP